MSDQELREAIEAMEVASPEVRDGIAGTFVAPANLDQMLLVFEAAHKWLDLTIVCPTCGGSGLACAPGCYEESEHPPCPDCIRGRQPSPEVREPIAVFAESGGRTWYVAGEGDPVEGWLIPLSEEDLANGVNTFLAAWLAEWRET